MHSGLQTPECSSVETECQGSPILIQLASARDPMRVCQCNHTCHRHALLKDQQGIAACFDASLEVSHPAAAAMLWPTALLRFGLPACPYVPGGSSGAQEGPGDNDQSWAARCVSPSLVLVRGAAAFVPALSRAGLGPARCCDAAAAWPSAPASPALLCSGPGFGLACDLGKAAGSKPRVRPEQLKIGSGMGKVGTKNARLLLQAPVLVLGASLDMGEGLRASGAAAGGGLTSGCLASVLLPAAFAGTASILGELAMLSQGPVAPYSFGCRGGTHLQASRWLAQDIHFCGPYNVSKR